MGGLLRLRRRIMGDGGVGTIPKYASSFSVLFEEHVTLFIFPLFFIRVLSFFAPIFPSCT